MVGGRHFISNMWQFVESEFLYEWYQEDICSLFIFLCFILQDPPSQKALQMHFPMTWFFVMMMMMLMVIIEGQ